MIRIWTRLPVTTFSYRAVHEFSCALDNGVEGSQIDLFLQLEQTVHCYELNIRGLSVIR